MPTFTAIALENLLEPSVRGSSPKNRLPLKQLPDEDKEAAVAAVKRSSHLHISPALYTTPKSTPIPTSPFSVSPSPYVVNRKRRDFQAPGNRRDGFNVQGKSPAEQRAELDGEEGTVSPMGEVCGAVDEVEQIGERDGRVLDVDIVGGGDSGGVSVNEGKLEGPDDDYLGDFGDTRDSMSVASSCDMDDRGCLHRSAWKHTPGASQSEFYDAPEDFLSDNSASSPSSGSNLQVDLRAVRLSLFEEIERRKKAEEALGCMRNQWQRVADRMSELGLSFPSTSDAGNVQLEIDSVEQFCQEVVVTRFVSEAIGSGQARSETEAATGAVIHSKNREIARLQDKLQYYEAVNHEMSQRNQEVKEMSRQQRKARKTRQRWMWSCIGLSIALGASMLVYSHLPQMGKELLPPSEATHSWSSITPESGELPP